MSDFGERALSHEIDSQETIDDLKGFENVSQLSVDINSPTITDKDLVEETIATIKADPDLQATIANPGKYALLLRQVRNQSKSHDYQIESDELREATGAKSRKFLDALFQNKVTKSLIQVALGKNDSDVDAAIRQIENDGVGVLETLNERMQGSVKEWLMYLGDPNPDLRTNLSHSAFFAVALAGEMRNFNLALKHFWEIRLRRGREVGALVPDERILSEAASFPVKVDLSKSDSEFLNSLTGDDIRQACVLYEQARAFFDKDKKAKGIDCTLLVPDENFDSGSVVKTKLKREWFSTGSDKATVLSAIIEVVKSSKQIKDSDFRVSKSAMESVRTKTYDGYKKYKADTLTNKIFGSEDSSRHMVFVLGQPRDVSELGDVSGNPWFITGGDNAVSTVMLGRVQGEASVYVKSAHRYSDGVEVVGHQGDPDDGPNSGLKKKFSGAIGELDKIDVSKKISILNEMESTPVSFESDFLTDVDDGLPSPEVFSHVEISEGEYRKLSQLIGEVRKLYSIDEKSISTVDLLQFALHLTGNKSGQIVVQQKGEERSLLHVGFSVVPDRAIKGDELLRGSLDPSEKEQLARDVLQGIKLFSREKQWAAEGRGTNPFFATLAGQTKFVENLFAFVGKRTAGHEYTNALNNQQFMLSSVSKLRGPQGISDDQPNVVDFYSAQTDTLRGTQQKSALGALGVVDNAEGGINLTARTTLDQSWGSIVQAVESFVTDHAQVPLYKDAIEAFVFDKDESLAREMRLYNPPFWDGLMTNIEIQIRKDKQSELRKVADVLPKMCDLLIEFANQHGVYGKREDKLDLNRLPGSNKENKAKPMLKGMLERVRKRG